MVRRALFSVAKAPSFADQFSRPAFFLFSPRNPLLTRWNNAIRYNANFIQRTWRKYFNVTLKTGRIPDCPTLKSEIPISQQPLCKQAERGGNLDAGCFFVFQLLRRLLARFLFVYSAMRPQSPHFSSRASSNIRDLRSTAAANLRAFARSARSTPIRRLRNNSTLSPR